MFFVLSRHFGIITILFFKIPAYFVTLPEPKAQNARGSAHQRGFCLSKPSRLCQRKCPFGSFPISASAFLYPACAQKPGLPVGKPGFTNQRLCLPEPIDGFAHDLHGALNLGDVVVDGIYVADCHFQLAARRAAQRVFDMLAPCILIQRLAHAEEIRARLALIDGLRACLLYTSDAADD